ncbi:MAG TPA: thiamine pyrophosphate-binding protein [Actinomycetes bacterium]|jgi:acetolactate synthase-1/2/3 large subunit|nr:thiamine pyrophosphate-binding protein [Actinomycetes bacterium]
MQDRSGGQVVTQHLLDNGVDAAFCVPGESFLAVLDALYDAPIRLITCRHEAAAANMAVAYGKLTGRPGVCLVTRGPGATQASVGVHTAAQDSAPMLLLVGQVGRRERGREAFQELDVPAVFGPMAKWAAEADHPARLPELLARAVQVAVSGRPGPVVLALPEDVLAGRARVADARPVRPVAPGAAPADLARLRELLGGARRPLVVAGGPGWTEAAAADLKTVAEASRLPVAASFRSQDVLDNRSPSYVGDLGVGANPALHERVRAADLLLAIGPRLGEITTGGYRLLEAPVPRQRLVHVHPGIGELGRLYQPDLAVNAAVAPFVAALRSVPPVKGQGWTAWTEAARTNYLAWVRPWAAPGRLDLGQVLVWLRQRLPDQAIVASGAGNYTGWVHRYFQFRRPGTQLAPKSGAMGFGLPAALAAKVVHPQRTVVAVAGDGDFLMTCQELATAVQHRLDVIVLVVNNGMYGTIRMHQERAYPDRVIASDLVNPDFPALARAYGAFGEAVEDTGAFPAAFERALEAGRPALLDLHVDPEAIAPGVSIAAVRRPA